jgi:hypothetical protein
MIHKKGFGGGLCGTSFNLLSMERGELCHDRCMVLLLEERMQDIGTAKPNARGAMYMPWT